MKLERTLFSSSNEWTTDDPTCLVILGIKYCYLLDTC